MEQGWLVRARWRRRGAWQWPAFAAVTAADAVIGHELPPAGSTQSLLAALILGCAINLLGVLLLSRPLGALIRRFRGDLPAVVAKDYGGTTVVVSVTVVLFAIGLAHRATIQSEAQALRDAIARAQAYIGDRAPAEFRRNLQWVSAFTIEAGKIYRVCVPSATSGRSYCVAVNRALPFPQGVSYAGGESNAVLNQGAW